MPVGGRPPVYGPRVYIRVSLSVLASARILLMIRQHRAAFALNPVVNIYHTPHPAHLYPSC